MDQAKEAAATAVKQDDGDSAMSSEGIPQTTTAADPATTAPEEPPPNPRLIALQNKHAALTTKLADLQAERAGLISQAKLPSGLAMPDTWAEDERSKHALSGANAVIKDHIRLLHEYNEIKDIGQGLMGLVAEGRGVRVKAVMEDFGMGEKD